jgi:hypothetical protein
MKEKWIQTKRDGRAVRPSPAAQRPFAGIAENARGVGRKMMGSELGIGEIWITGSSLDWCWWR